MPPIDGWPNILFSFQKSRSVFSGPGRLFLCLTIIFTKRISYSKAGYTKAYYCNKINNTHSFSPPFFRFLYRFLCNRRVTVPPQRATAYRYGDICLDFNIPTKYFQYDMQYKYILNNNFIK